MKEKRYPPIGDYALISDCHSSALVSRDGSVDWCCFHRFDARPVFARILDWSKGGYFRVAPSDHADVSRRYLPGTNVLETTFTTRRGTLVVTDCLPVAPDGARLVPYHQLIRKVRCEAGSVEIDFEFDPRFDYGLTMPRLEMLEDDLGVVSGGADALVIQSDLSIDNTDLCGCSGTSVLEAGQEACVVLTYQTAHEIEAVRIDPKQIDERVQATTRFWREWSDRCSYQGPYREQVVRSALVVKALTNAPTGAIVAAPTTSLPEEIGGVRNWDYRYTWLRDAALNIYALFTLGYTEEAHAFMGWLKRTTAGRVDDLQTLYGVGGERLVLENELRGLEGYRGSAPVRIGNRASEQFQLDIYGELLDTAWLYHRHGGDIDPFFWDFLRDTVDAVAERWTKPDHGIWEIRCEPLHLVSSKVMAWVAVDRGIRLAQALDLPADLKRWRALRKKIRRRIESEGVDGQTGAFVRAFGSDALDASNLLIPLVRFLPADDPRVRATMKRIEKELTADCLVDRYREDDGLPGKEGAFLICSFWLVDNLALAGEVDRACELFERLVDYANDVGLLSEEVDPANGELLGNFPQAFSHVGLIGAALNLEQARSGRTA
jgi:alpha,alpha-trehalase